MEWMTGMRGDEAQLKTLVDRLAELQGRGLAARTERAYLRMLLRIRLVEMRCSIDEVAGSTPAAELDQFAYRVRIHLPLFSHIESVINLVDEGCLDVSCA